MFSDKQLKYAVVLICCSMAQAGCSVSYSLEKSSDSVSQSLDSLTSITSISTSSSGGEKEKVQVTGAVYEEDVAALTVLYVSQKTSSDDYQRQVTKTAKNHGISNWEQEKSTFAGMGKGLKRSGIKEKSISNLAYFKTMAGSPHYSEVLEAYQM